MTTDLSYGLDCRPSTHQPSDLAAALLSKLRSCKNKAALIYWCSLRGEARCPARADLDPMEMREFLPNVILIDVLAQPQDFRFRLLGTGIDYHMSRNFRGLRFSEVPGQGTDSTIWMSCVTVVETWHPLSSAVPYIGPHRDFITSEDVIMPLSSDQERVDMLFVTVDYFRDNRPPLEA